MSGSRKFNRTTRTALAGAVALSGALAVLGATATSAPPALAATVSCGATPSTGYLSSDVAVDLPALTGVDVDTDGVVFVSAGQAVVAFTPTGGGYAASPLPGTFTASGVALGPGGVVHVVDAVAGTLEKLTPAGDTYVQSTVIANLGQPQAVQVDPDGQVFVPRTTQQRIIKLVPSGDTYVLSTVDSAPLGDVHGISSATTTLWFTMDDNTVRALNIPGNTTGTPLPLTGLSAPRGLDTDQGELVIADTGNDRLVRLNASGQSTVPAPGLDGPVDVAADADGILYVADAGSERVVRLSPITASAGADSATTTVDGPVTTAVLTNDSAEGPDDAGLADPTIAADPAHGTATVNANGTITYTPAPGFSGTDSYQYAVRDASGTVCATATVTVGVAQDNACGPIGESGGEVLLTLPIGAVDTPWALAADVDGSILVSNPDGDEIVRLTRTASGWSRSVAASGLTDPAQLTVGADGSLYVLSYAAATVTRLTPDGSGYTSAVIASGGSLAGPMGIAIDSSGDLFVSTKSAGGNGTVVRLDASAGYAQEVIATALFLPAQVAVDPNDTLFVVTSASVVRLTDTGAGFTKSNVVTGLSDAYGLDADATGALWVGDTGGGRILRATPSGAGYTTVVEDGWGDVSASSVAAGGGGRIYAIDGGTNDVVTLGPAEVDASDDVASTTTGKPVTVDVRANDATNTQLGAPSVVSAPAHGSTVVNPDGTITYTSDDAWSGTDRYSYEVRDATDGACSVATVTVTVSSAQGCGDLPSTADLFRIVATDGLVEPTGIAVDHGNVIYISDPGLEQVIGWGPGSGPALVDGRTGLDPQGIAVDADRTVFYADEDAHEIVRLTWSEAESDYARSVIATGLQRPSGVAVDGDGNVFFAERSSGHLHRLTPNGSSYTSSLIGSGLDRPMQIALDGEGSLFVADRGNDRIVKFARSGDDYVMSVVSTSVNQPQGVSVSPDGTVVVGDSGNHRVLRLTPTSTGYTQSEVTSWGTTTPTWVLATVPSLLAVVDADASEVIALGLVSLDAVDDSASTTTTTAVTSDVRANDSTAPDGMLLGLPTIVTPPEHGTAVVNDDGTITYTADPGFSGTDTYGYRISEDQEAPSTCDAATVSVDVANVFTDHPDLSGVEDTPLTVALTDLVSTTGRPLDPSGASMITAATSGTVFLDTGAGTLTYAPRANFHGDDTFTLRVCDTSVPVQCHDLEVSVAIAAAASATPTIVTRAARQAALRVTRDGATTPVALTDQVTITGFTTGGGSIGTATLHGPAPTRSALRCTPSSAAGSVTFTPRNGTFTTPAVEVSEPGYYTWVVSTSADADNEATEHPCGMRDETTLVHRTAVGHLLFKTGFVGRDPRARTGTASRVSVPAIGMSADLRPMGHRGGAMLIPTDVALGSWLTGSAAPGEAIGSTVLAGHVSDRRDRRGSFGRLQRARVGQVVVVRSGDGRTHRYRITQVSTRARGKGVAVSTTGRHQLVLVTCTGKVTYPNGRFHYTKNLVITAVPVG